jgi:capsular polysaccharide biosynthesis protein
MSHDLGHYLRPLRRHVPLLVTCVVIGLCFGLLGAVLRQPTYTAASRVQVQSTITDSAPNSTSGRTNGPVNLDTEAQLVKSLPTATIAAKILNASASPASLTSRVTVTVPPNTTVLKIAYQAHSAGDAIAGANAFATAYLQNRGANAQEFQRTQVDNLTSQLKSLRQDLVAVKALYRTSPPTSQAHHDQFAQISSDTTQINGLSVTLGGVRGAPLDPGYIVSKGVLGGSSPNQGRIILVLAGLVLGLLLGVALAALRERLDKTVRYEDDLAREGIRLLAEMRAPERSGRRNRQRAVDAESLARARAVQRVAAAVGAALGDRGGSIYLAELSKAGMDDRIDEQLAAELSRFGSTTEIVTLGSTPATYRPGAPTSKAVAAPPLSEPRAASHSAHDDHTNHDHAHHPADDMLGWPTPGSALTPRPTERPELRTDPPSELAQLPTARVIASADSTDAMSALLQQVQTGLARARYVILTGSDVPQGSEAYVLASLSQVSVIVAETGVTTRAALADVVEQISITPSETLGGLLWRPWTKAAIRSAPPAPKRRPKAEDPKKRLDDTATSTSTGVRDVAARTR